MTPVYPGNIDPWPSLPLGEWKDTAATLHMWTQIIGKIRLSQTPWINHSWHVTLYVTSRGLTTSPIPYGLKTFQIDFDFIDHKLVIETSDGNVRLLDLRPRTVADFYSQVMSSLKSLGIDVAIHTTPNEIPDPIPFEEDHKNASYDADYANRFWRVLVQTDRIFKEFRAHFIGKCSPVHFFWGSFDLAVTRFSGRTAPPHPGGVPHMPDVVAREAYSHEVSSCGFWPGGGAIDYPTYYAYAYPTPEGFKDYKIKPKGAFYSNDLGEFLLPYDEVRTSDDPDAALLGFLQSTYAAAADLAKWDRAALERDKLP
ncbi:MAG: hypothetical protein CL608_34160 [Anaerolineaceae bacterium]|nr:hypothetical protein [Anaerolineaceae bacterium]